MLHILVLVFGYFYGCAWFTGIAVSADNMKHGHVWCNHDRSKFSLSSHIIFNPVSNISEIPQFGELAGFGFKGYWFVPMMSRHFSSNKLNARLWVYVFTPQDPHLEWLKREESNGVYWFETRVSSLDNFKVLRSSLSSFNIN